MYPEVPLKDARVRCDEARKLLANQVDPSATRKAVKVSQRTGAANGFEAVAREWFGKYADTSAAGHSTRMVHQLAHAVRDPHGRAYNRTAHLPERQKMMQRWADYLDRLTKGTDVIRMQQ